MEACSLLVNLRKGMQSSSDQLLVGEEHYVLTLITAAKETTVQATFSKTSTVRCLLILCFDPFDVNLE